MKYIKTYEGQKYLKPKSGTINRFNRDYVCLISDYVNGTFVQDISKRVFQIRNIINLKGRIMYNLAFFNDKFFQWIPDESLRLATNSLKK